MLSHLTSRPGRIGAIVAFTLVAAAVIPAAPALAATGEGCPNEAVRAESNTNPSTGQPYSAGLPECRAYEMVSPLEKGGSDAVSVRGSFPVAADGDAVQFVSQNAFGDAENARSGVFGVPADFYVARRGAESWSTSSANPPRAVVANQSLGNLPLGRDASPEDFSTVSTCGLTVVNNLGAGSSAVCVLREPDGQWTSTPLYPNLTGSTYAEEGGNSGIEYNGSSADLADLVFSSRAAPGSAFLPADTSRTGGTGLYEVTRSGDTAPELSLVNVNDSGEEIGPENVTQLGGIGLNAENGSCLTGGDGQLGSDYQAISSSGSTIYFTACPSGGVDTVYARINRTSTVAISNPSPSQCTACSAAASPASFEGASADGSKAFFITEQPLVEGDEGGTGTGADLYEYDFDTPGKNLVQLSAGGAGDLTPGSGAEVQGVVRTSSDGSHVYFVAKGVLTTVPNGVGEVAQAGADNLYAVDTDTDETKFAAELCSNADLSGSVSDPQCPPSLNGSMNYNVLGSPSVNDTELWSAEDHLAQTTSDGRYLVFTTYAHLVASGAEAEETNDEAQQVYRYDFETGELARISIGEPSFPGSDNGNTPGMNASVAALPAGKTRGEDGALADINDLSRAISEDGSTIVFSTPEQLQANDVNTGANPGCFAGGTGCDVYVWHECTSSACEDGMSGEVHMISPGDDPTSEDADLGAASMSASGSDIFLFTRTPLVGQDTDQLADVYDARIDGGFPAPTPESSCSGEACQGNASSSPAFGAPGSQSFTGGQNLTPGSTSFPPEETKPKPKPLTRAQKLAKALKACTKKPKKQRASCEKQAKKTYGAKPRSKPKGKH